MKRHPHRVRRISAAFCVAVALCVLVPSPALPAPKGIAPGRQLWAASYGTAPKIDQATVLVVSPDGATVYVTGESGSSFNYSTDYATVAYDTTTGVQRWAARYDGWRAPKHGDDVPYGLAVSPDGARLFVTGLSSGSTYDYATVAYDAATGKRLWARRFGGLGFDEATSLGVSPDAKTLFVTGSSWTQASGYGYATVAYDAATGTRQWVARYGSGASRDSARALRVSSDGASVYVTGRSGGTLHHHYDYATVAYDAATGAQRWAARYDGPDHLADTARALAVSADGSRVFVTGSSNGASTRSDYATVAYDAVTGASLWTLRYDGPAHLNDVPQSLGLSPDGGRVFVTGSTIDPLGHHNYATAAYDAATGKRIWMKGYDGSTHRQDTAFSLGVSPDGSTVFVTGASVGRDDHNDDATIAYDAAGGSRLWIVRYHESVARSLGVSPDGTKVFVTGLSSPGFQGDYATVAYTTAGP